MDGWVFPFILILGMFVFPFVGVIVLLAKTTRQEENIRELRRIVERLQGENRESPPEPRAEAVYPAEDCLARTAAEVEDAAAPQASAEELSTNNTVPQASAEELSTNNAVPQTAAEELAPDEASPAAVNAALAPDGGSVDGSLSERENRLTAALGSFIKGGNLWAAGGVLLLTAGFGTLIAYLARRGFFTVEMGIMAAVAVGLVMILSGWRFRLKRPMFFVILQGGGVGILYLAVFAAHKLTPNLSLPLTLTLMSLLIPPAVILSVFQNSQGLALLGFLGGFLAPPLLSSGGGNHLFLFLYYLILDCGIFAIGFFRRWKGLNLTAFFFTFTASLYWTMTRYRPEFFLSSEPFFLAFIIIFTVLGLLGLKNQDYRFHHYSDVILILGTPAAAVALQWKIFSFVEHGYAFIALAFSAFYLALTVLILKRGNRAARSYAEAYLALGTILANLAIPLELSAGVTGALWAMEGAVLFFFGLRAKARNRQGEFSPDDFQKGDPRIMLAGVAVHLAAAVAFIRDIYGHRSELPAPWKSHEFSGSIIIAVSALLMAALAVKLSAAGSPEEKMPAEELSAEKKEGKRRAVIPFAAVALLAVWGLAWWFGGWYFEFRRVLPAPDNAFFILASATFFLCWTAVVFFGLKFLTIGMVPVLLVAVFTVLKVFAAEISAHVPGPLERMFVYNFFDASRFAPWLVFFITQGFTVLFPRSSKPSEPARFREARAFTVILTALPVLSATGRFATLEYGLSVSWTSLAGLLPLFIALAVFPFIRRGGQRRKIILPADANGGILDTQLAPFPSGKLLFPVLPFILSLILGLWFIVTLFLSGDPSPLPVYIPVLNPLDLLEALCIVFIVFWQIEESRGDEATRFTTRRKNLVILCDVMVFAWIVSILARSVHYYGGVSWPLVAGSDGFHVCLFVFWALYGILHIILGHHRRSRIFWIAGAVLVAADIAKLILFDMRDIGAVPKILSFFAAGVVLLFIGWAAPLPPPEILNRDDKTFDSEDNT